MIPGPSDPLSQDQPTMTLVAHPPIQRSHLQSSLTTGRHSCPHTLPHHPVVSSLHHLSGSRTNPDVHLLRFLFLFVHLCLPRDKIGRVSGAGPPTLQLPFSPSARLEVLSLTGVGWSQLLTTENVNPGFCVASEGRLMNWPTACHIKMT